MTYIIKCLKGELLVSDQMFRYKKPVLAIQEANRVHKLASFDSEETMKEFLKMFGWKGEEE